MHVDAIVNTTNEEMVGYSGVDLAVHTIAGKELDEECAKIAPLGLGQAKITDGYNLPRKYVIHTSGPRWRGGLLGEDIILRSCYIESLKLAVKQGCSSIAFPLISSGVYQYPKDQVLKFAIQTITEFLFENELNVFICVYDRDSYEFSQKLFNDIKEFIDDDYVEDHPEEFYDELEEHEARKRAESRRIQEEGSYFCCITKKRRSNSKESVLSDSDESIDACSIPYPQSTVGNKTLHEYMKAMDKPFAYKLFDLIDEKGMTDVECYKKANVDKRTFSKIKSNPKTYKPSKQTAVAFAIALKLNLEETQDLLASAGMTLSRSFTFDKIIRYFIQKEIYDIFVINEALFEFDQLLLGGF
jgi:O-acetyl-ADP-ribose deacetylase (regulator of RNase III)